MPELIELLTGGGVAAILVKWAYEAWKQRKAGRRHFSEQFKKRADVYEIMNQVLQSTHAKRFLIFKSSNGGGQPRVGSTIYGSCIYEDFNPPFYSVMADYQRVLLDRPYMDLLRRISTEDHVNILVKDMERGSILKSIYEKEHVAFSQVFYLSETKSAFYYCSISTDADGMNEQASDAEQLAIKIAVGKLKYIFGKLK